MHVAVHNDHYMAIVIGLCCHWHGHVHEQRVVMVKVMGMATMISMMMRLLAMTTMGMVGLVQSL